MRDEAPWADEPITSVEDDSFQRRPFAELVAGAIDRTARGASSTVFGLVGTWGSGKSSVAAMVASLLPASWSIGHFTPWAASGVAGLQLEFVAALDDALGGEEHQDQKFREVFKQYVSWTGKLLGAIPGGGPISQLAEKAAEEVARPKPWAAQFDAMSHSLSESERRVLIICDDIDRLDAVELLEFLKVVRLLGRFPNVHYLIAYDANTVEDLLAAQGVAGRASSFMEKIVQHPFELPTLDRALRWRHISSALRRVMAEHAVSLDEEGVERSQRLTDSLCAGLSTPRQIARFEQHLLTLGKLIPGEVDLLDFAAVVHLQLNYHEVYDSLLTWAPLLRLGLKDYDESRSEAKTLEEWQERIAATSRRAAVAGAWEVIEFLFPNLHSRSRSVLHPQALADPAYTERYFSLGVPANDISDVLVGRAVSSLFTGVEDGAAELMIAKLLDEEDVSVARLALDKILKRRRLLGPPAANKRSLEYIRARLDHTDTSDPSASSYVPLLDWLADESLFGYSAGAFDRDYLLELLGEDLALTVLLRLSAGFSSRRDERVKALLSDFADYVAERLRQPGSMGLEPYESLRLRLSLIERARGEEAVSGVLDKKIGADPQVFENVALAMVRIASWVGDSGTRLELEFEEETWKLVISEDVRNRMARLLPTVDPQEYPDRSDVSEENRRRYAIVHARRGAVVEA